MFTEVDGGTKRQDKCVETMKTSKEKAMNINLVSLWDEIKDKR